MIVDLNRLKEIAEIEFFDIVEDVSIEGINTLRIFLIDGSYLDVWYSLKLENRFSYHWERRHIDGSIYRHDNAPHKSWKHVSTFPKHFHDGEEENVLDSDIADIPEDGLRSFLLFIRNKTTD
jgi:hypothetical protein